MTVQSSHAPADSATFKMDYAPRDVAIEWSAEGLVYAHREHWMAADVYGESCQGTGIYILRPTSDSPDEIVSGKSVCDAFETPPGAVSMASKSGTRMSDPSENLHAAVPPDAALRLVSIAAGRLERPRIPYGPGESPASDPRWSPDGRRIAFVYWDAEMMRPGLYLVSPNGSGLRRLVSAHDTSFFRPTWSPDGARIAFERLASGEHRTDLAIIDTTDTVARPLTSGHAPSWSPDGSWIAFLRETDDSVHDATLELIHPDGTNEHVLFANRGDSTVFTNGWSYVRNGTPTGSLVWDPSGTWLAFSRRSNGSAMLWRIGVDGIGLRQLTTFRGQQ